MRFHSIGFHFGGRGRRKQGALNFARKFAILGSETLAKAMTMSRTLRGQSSLNPLRMNIVGRPNARRPSSGRFGRPMRRERQEGRARGIRQESFETRSRRDH